LARFAFPWAVAGNGPPRSWDGAKHERSRRSQCRSQVTPRKGRAPPATLGSQVDFITLGRQLAWRSATRAPMLIALSEAANARCGA